MSWFEKLTVDCVNSDIWETETEVIGCNANVMLSMNNSLGTQLLSKCGVGLLGELDKLREHLPGKRLDLGQAIWLDLQVSKFTKAVIFFGRWSKNNDFSEQLIYKCFVNTLRLAFKKEVGSIAFPFFGTGSESMEIRWLENSIMRVLSDLNDLKISSEFSVEEILFYSTKTHLVERLNSSLARLL